jgi:hypothetical protein
VSYGYVKYLYDFKVKKPLAIILPPVWHLTSQIFANFLTYVYYCSIFNFLARGWLPPEKMKGILRTMVCLKVQFDGILLG